MPSAVKDVTEITAHILKVQRLLQSLNEMIEEPKVISEEDIPEAIESGSIGELIGAARLLPAVQMDDGVVLARVLEKKLLERETELERLLQMIHAELQAVLGQEAALIRNGIETATALQRERKTLLTQMPG